MRIWMETTLSGHLKPADDASLAVVKKLPVGTTVECEVITRKARSGQWHRRYWAMMSMIASNVPQVEVAPGAFMDIHDSEDAHTAMKLLTGHVHTYTVQLKNKTSLLRIPKPTNFTDMDTEEWAAFYRKVLDAVHFHILPTVKLSYIEDEIARIAS